jgi:hypothetical protein
VLLAGSPAPAGEIRVPITVEERVGVARTAEPVTCGVPFPKGAVKPNSAMALLDADGNAVRAAVTPICSWHPDTSVKWVHVDFVASVPAKGKTTYTLVASPRTAKMARIDPMATQLDGGVVVDTGAIKFMVKEKGFNLFDSVSVGETPVVKSGHDGGLRLVSSHMGLDKNKVYTAAAYDRTKVEIEEQNDVKVVLKVTGRHVSTDDLPGPKRMLDYKLRIYAFRASPTVRVVYTVMNRQENQIHVPLPVDGIRVELPVRRSRRREAPCWIGRADGNTLATKVFNQVYVLAYASDAHELMHEGKPLEGKCKSIKPNHLGWAAVQDHGGGVMGGIRRFWQLWPKAVEVTGTRHLRLHLWANVGDKVLPLPKQDENTKPWNLYFKEGVDYPVEKALRSRLMPGRAHFYPGMSKTHEMVFYFFAKPDAAKMTEKWMGLERPLRAVCTPSWYCEETRAFGRLASADKSLFDDATWKQIAEYDKRFRDWLDWLIWYRGKEYGKNRGVYDQYGMFDFGDCINWERMKGKYRKPEDAVPVSFHWDNCYYDTPHALMLQFLRTGDLDFFEHAMEADHHYIDVDMVCHHPRKDMVGAPRYCPGRMHICMDGKSVYVSNTYNHFKNLCHFDLWLLVGDHHARDRGYMQADFVVNRGRNSLSQSRSIGHGIRGALVAYRASGKKKYLDTAKKLVNYRFTRTRSGAWQDGIALEGFRELYEQTGDEKLVETIKNGAATAMKRRDHAAAMLHAYAFVYHLTGDRKYRQVALSRIPKAASPRKMWGSTQSLGNKLRNAPYTFWYLSEALREEVKAEKE